MRSCEYCHVDKDSYISGLDRNGHVWIHKPDVCNELIIRYYGQQLRIPIKYCPICGRKFRGEDE